MNNYHYSIGRLRGAWTIFRLTNGRAYEIASFPTRKEALMTAKLLAGWRSKVTTI
jgi:hypothetical protein